MRRTKYLRTCACCGKRFFSEGEKRYYDEHKLSYPNLCKACREVRKQLREEKKKIDEFYKRLPAYVALNELVIEDPQHTLVVIGNGFDKMHGVPSGYYDFRNFMGKRNELRENLEYLIDSDDVWGNFEENLARLNYSSFYEGLDGVLHDFGSYRSYKEDGSIAGIMAPAEMLMEPVDIIVEKLPKVFRKWVNSLPVKPKLNVIEKLLKPGLRYLNFNYTEFLETIYGIDHKNITYIHGYRKSPKDILVVGHSEKNEYLPPDPKGIPNYKDPDMQGVFEEAALQISNHMNWYDDAVTKHTNQIIKEHRAFFDGLTDVNYIVTLGHSLSSVDWPYYKEMIRASCLDNVQWLLSFYSDDDLIRIFYFCQEMGIEAERVVLVDLR